MAKSWKQEIVKKKIQQRPRLNLRDSPKVSASDNTFGMLESATYPLSLLILIEKLALNPGSSKQGKAMRASVGSKSVTAIILWHEETTGRILQVKPRKEMNYTFRTQLIKPRGDIFDFSNYNLSESRLSF